MKVIYCQKKHSDWKRSHCSGVAAYMVTMRSRTASQEGKLKKQYRCEDCKTKPTVKFNVVAMEKVDQSEILAKVTAYLQRQVGKKVYSSWHKNKIPYIAEYVRGTGLICKIPGSKKYQFVNYDQVAALPPAETGKLKRLQEAAEKGSWFGGKHETQITV